MAEPRLNWDIATGYDFFMSLEVLHDPGYFGVRGQWAAGVRSRLPGEQREFLQDFIDTQHVRPIFWVAHLSGAKDAQSVLAQLAAMSPEERLPAIRGCEGEDEIFSLLLAVKEQGSWTEADQSALRDAYRAMYQEEGKKKKIADEKLATELDHWANAAVYGEKLLDALQSYYDAFFSEEEKRIRPALEAKVTQAEEMAAEMSLSNLMEELSEGVRFDKDNLDQAREIQMIPSFWITPRIILTSVHEPVEAEKKKWIFVFGGRPADESLVPGEAVPELLHQTLKALADPTRLRILHYLSAEPMSPTQLANRLRLRAPTVIHHLDTLRLARLVQVTFTQEGRRYEARRGAVDAACDMLQQFLDGA